MTLDQIRNEILDVERRRQEALVAVDVAALDALFADDLQHIHSTGLVHTKTELLQHIDRKRGFLGIERGPLQLRVEANIAILSGPIVNHMRGPEGGEILLDGFVTQVLRKDGDEWKFIHFQFTPNRK